MGILLLITEFYYMDVCVYGCVIAILYRKHIDTYRSPECLVIYFLDILMISKIHPTIQRKRKNHFSWADIQGRSTLTKIACSHWGYLAFSFKRQIWELTVLLGRETANQIISVQKRTVLSVFENSRVKPKGI